VFSEIPCAQEFVVQGLNLEAHNTAAIVQRLEEGGVQINAKLLEVESNQVLRLDGPCLEEVALLLHVASSPNRECLDTVHAEFGVSVDDGLVHFVCDSSRSEDFSLHGGLVVEVVFIAAL
jgi:hypothetical protein